MQDLLISDGDGATVKVHGAEAAELWRITAGFDAATISACGDCGCRVLAAVALVDLVGRSLPHDASSALIDLADEAPTLHVYLRDSAGCEHRQWRDPGYDEWCGAFGIARRRGRRGLR